MESTDLSRCTQILYTIATFVLFAASVCFHILDYVWITEWPIRKTAAHLAYNVFSNVPDC